MLRDLSVIFEFEVLRELFTREKRVDPKVETPRIQMPNYPPHLSPAISLIRTHCIQGGEGNLVPYLIQELVTYYGDISTRKDAVTQRNSALGYARSHIKSSCCCPSCDQD